MWWESLLVCAQGPCQLQKASALASSSPLVSSFSSETGKCFSRAKASPQAQLSCSKVGSVESCFLSCPAHTLFMPGNLRLSRDGLVGGGLPSLGSSPCSLLFSRREPHPGVIDLAPQGVAFPSSPHLCGHRLKEAWGPQWRPREAFLPALW